MVTKHTCSGCGYMKTICQCNPMDRPDLTDLAIKEAEQRQLRANHLKERSHFDPTEYIAKLTKGSTLNYSIAEGEKLSSYVIRLREHVKLAAIKNVQTHIHNNGRGPWFTHQDKMGQGCFMDEDLNLYTYLLQIIEWLAALHPNDTLKHPSKS